MKTLKTLFLTLVLLAASAALAGEPPLLPYEAGAPAATHPALYSFADLYRLSVSGEPFGGFRFADAQAPLRFVSQASGLHAAEMLPDLSFSVSAPSDGGRWALVLAGLFACAWVAHRRLASPY